jgi:hypothetical protein
MAVLIPNQAKYNSTYSNAMTHAITIPAMAPPDKELLALALDLVMQF